MNVKGGFLEAISILYVLLGFVILTSSGGITGFVIENVSEVVEEVIEEPVVEEMMEEQEVVNESEVEEPEVVVNEGEVVEEEVVIKEPVVEILNESEVEEPVGGLNLTEVVEVPEETIEEVPEEPAKEIIEEVVNESEIVEEQPVEEEEETIVEVPEVVEEEPIVEEVETIPEEVIVVEDNETNLTVVEVVEEIVEDVVNESEVELNVSLEEITLNETNVTIVNESNLTVVESNVTVDGVLKTEEVVVSQVVINKPVKWVKKVKLDKPKAKVSVEVPKNVENISVYKVVDGERGEDVEFSEEGAGGNLITGNVVYEGSGDFGSVFGMFKSFFFEPSVTGMAVGDVVGEVVGEIVEDPVEEVKEIIVEEEVEELEVEYYTEGPGVIEEEISENKKKVVVYSDIHYENILAYTSIRDVESGFVKLYRTTGGVRESVEIIDYVDTDSSGLIDEIYWIVPSLSNESYLVEITILNVQSYPVIGGNWTVMFETSGSADLRIRAANETSWSDSSEDYDLKFLEIKCGDTVLEYIWENDSVFVSNYSCDSEGYETSKVITGGVHDLEFDFGGMKAYAHNLAGWANASFDRCMNISIESAVTSTLEDFPYYLNISKDSEMMDDFSDLRFFNNTCVNGGTELSYEIENYTGNNAYVWVKVPSLTPGGVNISVYYKNNTGVSSGESKADVWDDDYVGVWHMSELDANDSTGINNGTASGDPVLNLSGVVDGAVEFDGVGDYIGVGDVGLEQFTSGVTVSSWVYIKSDNTYQSIYEHWANNKGFLLWVNDDDRWRFQVDATSNEIQTATGTVNTNVWTHVVGIFNGTDTFIYLNGIESAFGSVTGLTDEDVTADIGGHSSGGAGDFNGTIDEVRISNVARSADWINQTYQMLAGSFANASYDGEQNISVPSNNKFVITNNSGDNVVSIDDKGDMFLKGNVLENQASLIPSVNSFIIEDSAGSVVSYINSTGYLFLLGSVYKNSDLSGMTSSNLEFRNSTDDLVAFFDNEGNLTLQGELVENYENP